MLSKDEIKAALAKEKKERQPQKKKTTIYWPVYIVASLFTVGIILIFTIANYESPKVKAMKEETKLLHEKNMQSEAELRKMQSNLDYGEKVVKESENLLRSIQEENRQKQQAATSTPNP